MLERERELREREKQRDAWYRHAQTQGAAVDGRSAREREERERQRAFQEDEYQAARNRTEDGEYQRVLADVSDFADEMVVKDPSLMLPLSHARINQSRTPASHHHPQRPHDEPSPPRHIQTPSEDQATTTLGTATTQPEGIHTIPPLPLPNGNSTGTHR